MASSISLFLLVTQLLLSPPVVSAYAQYRQDAAIARDVHGKNLHVPRQTPIISDTATYVFTPAVLEARATLVSLPTCASSCLSSAVITDAKCTATDDMNCQCQPTSASLISTKAVPCVQQACGPVTASSVWSSMSSACKTTSSKKTKTKTSGSTKTGKSGKSGKKRKSSRGFGSGILAAIIISCSVGSAIIGGLVHFYIKIRRRKESRRIAQDAISSEDYVPPEKRPSQENQRRSDEFGKDGDNNNNNSSNATTNAKNRSRTSVDEIKLQDNEELPTQQTKERRSSSRPQTPTGGTQNQGQSHVLECFGIDTANDASGRQSRDGQPGKQ